MLGICYGMQILAKSLGGDVKPCEHTRGYGLATITIKDKTGLLGKLGKRNLLDCWMSHGDEVVKVPKGFSILATGEKTPVMAMGSKSKKIYGLQFHPEVTHTNQGTEILQRFASDVCGCKQNWTMPKFIEMACETISKQVGKQKILLGLSGGVDSAVAAALIEKAVPNQLTCVFVDNGLLRLGEVKEVQQAFAHLGNRLITVDASKKFFSALAGIADPEKKRKAIGRTFIKVFQHEAKKLGSIKWLGQGTIYPDVVESAGTTTGVAASIKSHHNVGGLPTKLGLNLLEPLRLLFKDEVRKVGIELGLPKKLINRHPFPGPGLAVRVLGEVTEQRVKVNQLADAIFISQLKKSGWYEKVAQAFTVLLPIHTVGVQGDNRTFENVIALRAVVTDDFMTADWAKLPASFLARCSRQIINEVNGVNRVVYDVSSKPPATVEWE